MENVYIKLNNFLEYNDVYKLELKIALVKIVMFIFSQCRLKFCGIKEAIILVEEYGSIQNFSISEERIKQSIVNSQVITVGKCWLIAV